jgi:hypothetical protein
MNINVIARYEAIPYLHRLTAYPVCYFGIALYLPMTSYKNGSRPELVSGSHRTGDRLEVYLASGVPKQVRHDSGNKNALSFPLQSPRIFKLAMTGLGKVFSNI